MKQQRFLIPLLILCLIDLSQNLGTDKLSQLCQPESPFKLNKDKIRIHQKWTDKSSIEILPYHEVRKMSLKKNHPYAEIRNYDDNMSSQQKSKECHFGKIEEDPSKYRIYFSANNLTRKNAMLFAEMVFNITIKADNPEFIATMIYTYADHPNILVESPELPLVLRKGTESQFRVLIRPQIEERILGYVSTSLLFTNREQPDHNFIRTFLIPADIEVVPNDIGISISPIAYIGRNELYTAELVISNNKGKPINCTAFQPYTVADLVDITINLEDPFVISSEENRATISVPAEKDVKIGSIEFMSHHAGFHYSEIKLLFDGVPYFIPYWINVERNGLNMNPNIIDVGLIDATHETVIAPIYAYSNTDELMSIVDFMTFLPRMDVINVKILRSPFRPHFMKSQAVQLIFSPRKFEGSMHFQGKIAFFITSQEQDPREVIVRATFVSQVLEYDQREATFILNPNSSQYYEFQEAHELAEPQCEDKKLTKISKRLTLQNKIQYPLVIRDYHISDPYLFLENFQLPVLFDYRENSPLVLNLSYVFDQNSTNTLNKKAVITFYTYETTFSLAINIVDLRIVCTYQDSKRVSTTEKCIHLAQKSQLLNLGVLPLGEEKEINLSFFNPNPEPIRIMEAVQKARTDLFISIIKQTDEHGNELELESVGPQDIFLAELGTDHEIFIQIKPNASSIGKYQGKVNLITDQLEHIEIPYQFTVWNGSLVFEPQVIDFEEVIFGLEYEKNITIRNEFSETCNIEKVFKSDPRLAFQVYNKNIEPDQSSSIKVIFQTFENRKESEHIIIARQFEPTGTITVEDVSKWQALKALKRNFTLQTNKQEFSNEIFITTNILKQVSLKLKAKLKYPEIAAKKIYKGPITKFEYHQINLTITNPTSDPIFIEFFIAPDNLVSENNILDLVLKNQHKSLEKICNDMKGDNERRECLLGAYSHSNLEEPRAIQVISQMTNRHPILQRNAVQEQTSVFNRIWESLVSTKPHKQMVIKREIKEFKQPIFLNTKYRKRNTIIPPHSTQELSVAQIYLTKQKEKGLILIKNNLTGIEHVKIEATAGEIKLRVVEILMMSTDGIFLTYKNYDNLPFQEFSFTTLYQLFCKEGNNTDGCQHLDWREKLEQSFSGMITIKNEGTSPLPQSYVTIDGGVGCAKYDFEFISCEVGQINPGEMYNISMKAIVGFDKQRFKRTLYVDSQYERFEVPLDIKIPDQLQIESLYGYDQTDYWKASIIFILLTASITYFTWKHYQEDEKEIFRDAINGWNLKTNELWAKKKDQVFLAELLELDIMYETAQFTNKIFRNDTVKKAVTQILKPVEKKAKQKFHKKTKSQDFKLDRISSKNDSIEEETDSGTATKQLTPREIEVNETEVQEPQRIPSKQSTPRLSPKRVIKEEEFVKESDLMSKLDQDKSQIDYDKLSERKLNLSNIVGGGYASDSYHQEPEPSISEIDDTFKLKQDAEILDPYELELSTSRIGMIGEAIRSARKMSNASREEELQRSYDNLFKKMNMQQQQRQKKEAEEDDDEEPVYNPFTNVRLPYFLNQRELFTHGDSSSEGEQDQDDHDNSRSGILGANRHDSSDRENSRKMSDSEIFNTNQIFDDKFYNESHRQIQDNIFTMFNSDQQNFFSFDPKKKAKNNNFDLENEDVKKRFLQELGWETNFDTQGEVLSPEGLSPEKKIESNEEQEHNLPPGLSPIMLNSNVQESPLQTGSTEDHNTFGFFKDLKNTDNIPKNN